jgi:hypothetical protein
MITYPGGDLASKQRRDMILGVAVILGLVASLIRHRGQTASQIASIPLHWIWLALLALALQVPLLLAPSGRTRPLAIQQSLFLLSQLLLLAFVWQNRRLTGIQILGLGVLCNILVIAANDGFMPVTPETLVRINPGSTLGDWGLGYHYGGSKDIILPRERTDLWLLSDILVLPSPFPWPTAFSLGDILIAVGVVVLLQGPAKRSQTGTTSTLHSEAR